MASAPLARRGRLTRSADFDKVMRSGRSHAGRDFVLYIFPRGGEDPPRLGVSVSRRVGGAVDRNLVKRLIRESFARRRESLPAGVDAVVIARSGARELAEAEGFAGVERSLGELFEKALTGQDSAARGHRPAALSAKASK